MDNMNFWYGPYKGAVRVAKRGIAVDPFPKSDNAPVEVKRAFASDNRRGKLVPLKVLIGNTDFPTGSIIYTRSENAVQPWAKELLSIGVGEAAVEVIFIPETEIYVVDDSNVYKGYGAIPYAFNGVHEPSKHTQIIAAPAGTYPPAGVGG